MSDKIPNIIPSEFILQTEHKIYVDLDYYAERTRTLQKQVDELKKLNKTISKTETVDFYELRMDFEDWLEKTGNTRHENIFDFFLRLMLSALVKFVILYYFGDLYRNHQKRLRFLSVKPLVFRQGI